MYVQVFGDIYVCVCIWKCVYACPYVGMCVSMSLRKTKGIATHVSKAINVVMVCKEDWKEEELVLFPTHAIWIPTVNSYKPYLDANEMIITCIFLS